MPENELDRLAADIEPQVLTLSSGIKVELLRLRTRQLFKLLKILTHGVGPRGIEMMDFTLPPQEFIQRMVTVILMSIPDAEQETLEFLATMVQPVGIINKPTARLTKQEREANEAKFTEMNYALVNPPIEDTIDLLEAIISAEGPEWQALGNRLARTWKLFQATGQDSGPASQEPSQAEVALASQASAPASPESLSEVPSPPSSTSSQPSTAGETNEFLTSPLDASASVPTPSGDDASVSSGSG